MAYITTEWDYGLKAEVFVVNGDKGYAHTTDTLLYEVDDSRNANQIEYFTAMFTVDVKRDIQDSKVVIYDNGEAIPIYIDDDPVQMIDWQQGGQTVTFTARLGYDTQHNIYAKYLGNNKGLPSKSPTITISEPLPNLYGTLIERTNDTSQFDTNQPISIPIQFTTNRTFESSEVKTIEIYVDGVAKTGTNITLNSGQTTATGTITLQNGLSAGLHQLEIRFEGDGHNESFNLPFSISVGYQLNLIDHSPIISETRTDLENLNYITYKVTDYLNAPIEDATIKLSDGTTDYGTTTTDSEGIAHFTEITTLPSAVRAVWEKGNNITYNSSDASLPVIRVGSAHMGAESVIAEGYSANVVVTIQNWTWIHNPQNNLEGIPVIFADNFGKEGKYYTNADGVATIPYVGANKGNVVLSANVGYGITEYAYITDLAQYWNTQTTIINKDYRILAPNFYELNSGFKFEVRASNALSLIGFGDGEMYNGDWTVSFKVVSASKNIKLVAGDWFDSSSETWENLLQTSNLTLKGGQTITISYTASNDNGLLKIELPNGSNQSLEVVSKGYPLMGIISETAKAQLTIDNVRFRRVE